MFPNDGRLIEMRDLRLFLAVIEAGGFSAASRDHGLSQPALSRVIQRLEGRVGARLFDRDSRKLKLTPAGERMADLATRTLLDVDHGLAAFGRFVRGEGQSLAVAALPSLAATLLPRAIARFRALHPEVDIRIEEGLAGEVVAAVTDGRADLGLTTPPPAGEALVYEPLATEVFEAVMSRAAAARLGPATELSWRALADLPLIVMAEPSSVRAVTDAAFLQAGRTVTALFECRQLATAGGLIAQDLGVSALPRSVAGLLVSDQLVWRPLAPTASRSVGAIHRRGAAPTAFLDALKAEPEST